MKRSMAYIPILALVGALILSACAPGAAQPTPSPAPPAVATPTAAEAAQPTPAPEKPVEPVALRIMSGPMGGAWYPLAGAIADIIQNEIPGVTVDVQPGGGILNVEGVNMGKADIGFSNASSAADGVAGIEPFTAPQTNVRNLMNLYNLAFHLATPEDSGIQSVADLRKKVISTQPAGNTGELMTQHVLQVYGMSYGDLDKVHMVSHADSVNLVKDRHADVLAGLMNVPGPAISELTMARKMRLISLTDDDIEKLNEINSGYVKFVIPQGSYPEQTEDVIALGTVSHLIVNADLPENLVYKISEALHKNIDKLVAIVKDVDTDPNSLGRDLGVPFHPGAEQYYEEIGAR